MKWFQEFHIATQAAVEAGTILREEWHRGPRGYDEHAVIDALVEKRIQRRLLQCTTSHQYLGEELGRVSGTGQGIWIVDPNDGTQHYLKKRRGASVSIAFLYGGIPRIGIVFAYNHPNDAGTLVTWAEDAPVCMNGRTLWRQWPTHLASCKFLFPIHFPVQRFSESVHIDFLPSIAYRLALVAAGTFDTTFTLNHPHSWDIAAGHAILLASKGRLRGEENKEPIYDLRGECHYRGGIFAGMPMAVDYLRQQARNLTSAAEITPREDSR